MAAAPAPPPRSTKEKPPPVPKRGGKRMSFATERVRVAVRVRPLVAHEAGQEPSVRCVDRGALEVTTPSAGGVNTIKKYDFDLCLDPSSTEDAVFEALGAKALLDRALRGIKATVFAYGATGSGKTHTILGHEREDFDLLPQSPGVDKPVNDRDGLVARAVKYLYQTADSQLQIRASFFEVYCEQIYDLLEPNDRALPLREGNGGFFAPGLTELDCHTSDDVEAILREGRRSRRKASHKLNRDSSRSHALLVLRLAHGAARGRVTFVDLAGNERLKRSKDSDPRETGAINRSLQALGKVIATLSKKEDNNEHVPYRDSTLTKLLMDSLGGDAATLMVACASPAAAHVDETLCTLGYARRARGIVNAPFATLVGADTGLERRQAERDRNEIEKLREDVARLRAENVRLSEENARLLELKTVEEDSDDDYDQISVVSRGGTRRHQRVKRKAPQKVLKDFSVSEPPPTNDVEDKLRMENEALKEELHQLTQRFDRFQGEQDYQFSQVQEAHATQQSQWAAALERLQTEHKREIDGLNEEHARQLKDRPKSSDSAEDYYKKFYTENLLNHQRKVDPTFQGRGDPHSAEQTTRNLSDHHETELISVRRSQRGEVVKKHRDVSALLGLA